jgi:hypothetical protein
MVKCRQPSGLKMKKIRGVGVTDPKSLQYFHYDANKSNRFLMRYLDLRRVSFGMNVPSRLCE